MTLDPALIAEWKQKYSTVRVHPMEGDQVVYRSLTTTELLGFQEMEKNTDPEVLNTLVVKTAVLNGYPEFQKVGSYTTLARFILEYSALPTDAFDTSRDAAREWAKEQSTNLNLGLAARVAAIFPGINILDLLNMTTDRLFRTIAILELVTQQDIFDMTGEAVNTAGAPVIDNETLESRGISQNQVSSTHSALSEAMLNGESSEIE